MSLSIIKLITIIGLASFTSSVTLQITKVRFPPISSSDNTINFSYLYEHYEFEMYAYNTLNRKLDSKYEGKIIQISLKSKTNSLKTINANCTIKNAFTSYQTYITFACETLTAGEKDTKYVLMSTPSSINCGEFYLLIDENNIESDYGPIFCGPTKCYYYKFGQEQYSHTKAEDSGIITIGFRQDTVYLEDFSALIFGSKNIYKNCQRIYSSMTRFSCSYNPYNFKNGNNSVYLINNCEEIMYCMSVIFTDGNENNKISVEKSNNQSSSGNNNYVYIVTNAKNHQKLNKFIVILSLLILL